MKQKRMNERTAFRFRRFGHRAYSAFNSMHKTVTIGVIGVGMLTFANSTETSAQTTIAENPQKITEKELELEEVKVAASRADVSLNQAAQLVTVITRDEIQRVLVQNVQDPHNYAAGTDVIQQGGSPDQTAILLLSEPYTAHHSFDVPVNLHDIERVKIIHRSLRVKSK